MLLVAACAVCILAAIQLLPQIINIAGPRSSSLQGCSSVVEGLTSLNPQPGDEVELYGLSQDKCDSGFDSGNKKASGMAYVGTTKQLSNADEFNAVIDKYLTAHGWKSTSANEYTKKVGHQLQLNVNVWSIQPALAKFDIKDLEPGGGVPRLWPSSISQLGTY